MNVDLNNMTLFVEVVKSGGFRKASDVTGVPNSTISRRISNLEKSIGLRLLYRTTRRIELTEAGRAYFERCKQIVEEARLAHEQLGDMLKMPSGVLRVSLPTDFAIAYMAPLIAKFSDTYPKIRFDIDLNSRYVDLVSERFDVAIHIGEPYDSRIIARKITTISPHLYASPEYLKLAGTPHKPSDLEKHSCITMLKDTHWHLKNARAMVSVPISSKYSVNNIGMIVRLGSLGQGIVLISEGVIKREIRDNNLVRVMPQWSGQPISVYALTENRLLPAKTQYFIDFLLDML